MEIVEGTTLTEWLTRRPPHHWRDVFAAFVAAGRGLAAAHAADVVHRDFKPDNVLVGRDGRISVSDFGLARAGDIEPVSERKTTGAPELETRITCSQTQLGTPAYMAPEQRENARAADARSDQYSFCASLHEGLWGVRPGSSRKNTGSAARGRVPRQLRSIVSRGLRVDPAQRYPSMTALLAALARVERRRRRVAVAVVLCAMAAVVVVPHLGQGDPNASVCAAAAQRLDGVWDVDHKRAVRAAVVGHRTIYGPTLSNAIEHALDAYAGRWIAMHTEACEATAIHHDQPDSVLAVRMACLDQRRQELEQAVVLLADGATPPDHALEVATALSPVAGCADLPALSEVISPPSDLARSVHLRSLRQRFASLKAKCDANLYATCATAARGLLDEARALAYPPLLAQLYFEIGSAEAGSNHPVQAEQALEEAKLSAEAGRDDHLAAIAMVLEAEMVVTAPARSEESARLLRNAEASVARLATISPRSAFATEGFVLAGRLFLALDRQDMIEAARLGADALRYAEETEGHDAPTTAKVHVNLGVALQALGRLDEAMAHDQRAREIFTALEGRGHPDLLALEPNIAIVLDQLGRHDEAGRLLERVLTDAEATFGRNDPRIVPMLDTLTTVRMAQRRPADALALVDRALAIAATQPDRARAEHITELANRGAALGMLERDTEADDSYRKAIAAAERWFGPDTQLLVPLLQHRALASVDAGHPRAAIALFERALSIVDRADGPPLDAARVRMGFATALVSIGERARAVDLARTARARIAHVTGGERLLPSIDAFLAAQSASVLQRP
jgi:tetratricopeptide (TPR) repeat protein